MRFVDLIRGFRFQMQTTLALIGVLVLCSVAPNQLVAKPIDFNRDIRSILSDKCFLCHGPDEETREAGLRLDVREDAIDSEAIVPGDIQASEIIARMTSSDPDLVMPPPKVGKPVTPQQVDTFKSWIAQDAIYAKHWAFEVPQRPNVPRSSGPDWARNAIDHFVFRKMLAKGIKPSPTASPEILARRMSLDLVGLPPTIEQLDSLSADPSQMDDQLRSLANQYLESPHFGERWGRWWLDAARYADSAGYEKDMPRQVWFYRDWVINAMNQDMAYDKFVVEQIAGDLLPNAKQSQRVATGFLRNSMTNEEGGADPEQFRVEGMFDRMDAIGKAILGITTQCAQCHTHKYDPLSHHEYYGMFAALNDFHEACVTVYTPEQQIEVQRIVSEVNKVYDRLVEKTPDWRTKVDQWAKSLTSSRPSWQAIKPTEHPYVGEKFKILDDGSIVSESYAPTKTENAFAATAHVGTISAVRLDVLTHPQLPRGGPGRSVDGTGALTEFKLRIEPVANDSKPIDVKFVRAISDVNPKRRGLKSQYRDRNPAKDDRVVGPIDYAIDGDLKTAWTTDLDPGRRNQSRHAIFVPEEPIVIDGDAKLHFSVVMKHGGWNSDDNQNFLLGRYRFSITDAPEISDDTIDSLVEPILDIEPEQRTADQWRHLFTQWVRVNSDLLEDDRSAELAEIDLLWQQYPETATQLVVQSLGESRETFVLNRGDFLRPSDRVEPNTPSFLNPMPETDEPDRLRFARWLASKDSPTTARVIVNRIWQAYFGRGLVTSPEDFGYQSTTPSHPDLLDFLAVELVEHDWSLKHIHQLVLNSATYRQSSSASEQSWQLDPDNQWLGRGPRVRVEAEMVRDLALTASGLLDEEIGGPSVYPPAPRFLFEPPTSYGPKIWDSQANATQYRRSIYVHQYRSVPYPPLQVFDAPKGDAACVRRERSNTPLQALVLMNESQFVDAARALATRTIREVVSKADISVDRQRIGHAFRLCTSRKPNQREIDVLETLLRQQRERWMMTGERKTDKETNENLSKWVGVSVDRCLQLTNIDARELAAWMSVCRAILNLDETISKS